VAGLVPPYSVFISAVWMAVAPAPKQSYYEGANPDLLYRIPVNACVVLEVGCGAGGLGAAYKAINPNVTYIGLEYMEEPAALARHRLDHVLTVDVEQNPTPQLPIPSSASVDCLVYGDVLEHLRDPLAVLQQQLQWLKPDGVVLACIPNVQHWSVLAQLLAGRWPQEDQGLFDRTHLRWFTQASVVELITAAGLTLHDITPRIFAPQQAQAFVQQLAPALPGLGIDPQALLTGVSPLQYVVRAGRHPAAPLLLSGLLMQPQVGMNDVRMIQPLRSVASCPGVAVELSHEGIKLLPADSAIPRILIFQRQSLSYEHALPMLRKALAAGYVLVSEFDDDPEHFPAIPANRYLNFTAMHAVQVSTAPLAEVIRSHNPEVEMFENAVEYLPPLANRPWPQQGDGQPLRLFFGALNRQADWEPWMAALNAALAADPGGWLVEVVHDQAFFDALQTPHKCFTPTCAYATYREVMGRCHVAFLPLADTRFNRMKSDLKLVEAASHGLAVLASPVVYGPPLAERGLGQVWCGAEQLQTTLQRWRADPVQAEALGAAGRAWVQAERLQRSQSGRREAWYRQLWQRRAELTTRLLERVPELAG
jgi:SAM-dependent methyltransferase/glycosyltransferase involved in cell wall biosynthesis